MGTATTYEPHLTLGEARTRYFVDNGFGEEGNYDEPFVKLSLGPIPVVFPNSAARVRAVRYHDLHHVLTGYATTLTGEAEIGAWELATGCGSMPAAWILNALAMVLGLLLDRGAVFAAFVRGRYSENLYGEPDLDGLLTHSLGERRARLRLDREPPPPTALDRAHFVAYAAGGVALHLLLLTLLLIPLAATAWLVAAVLGA